MISGSMFQILAAANVVQKDPGIIVKPFTIVLGWLLNLVFNVVYTVTSDNCALGFSIITLTLLVRCLMIPLAVKQQKSMFIMQKIQPEVKKIQDKYKGNTDPEISRKMNAEIQKLYAKHKYNPFSGCLPMLIQFPIFIALYYILQNPYQFIGHVSDIYNQLGEILMADSNYVNIIAPLASEKVPAALGNFDIGVMSNLAKLMNKLTLAEWDTIKSQVPAIGELLTRKTEMEYFFGLSLTERVGLGWPNVLIPVFSGLSTFFSSWLMTRRSASNNTDPAIKSQQRIMNTVMPLVMAWITSTIPGGVGIYWITSNVFQIVQQLFINSYYDKKMKEEASK